MINNIPIDKTDVAKMAISFVTFESVNTIVDPAVKSIVPKTAKPHKRVLAKIGSYTISAAITHAITKEVDEIIDTVIETKAMCDELKANAIKTAMEYAESEDEVEEDE